MGMNMLCIFLVLRLFPLLTFHEHLALTSYAIANSLNDLLHFILIFIIVVLGYSLVGHVAFGVELQRYETMWNSVQTMFQMSIGDFDYAELQSVHSVVAPAFFISYILLVVLILVNVFLAIVLDAFVRRR